MGQGLFSDKTGELCFARLSPAMVMRVARWIVWNWRVIVWYAESAGKLTQVRVDDTGLPTPDTPTSRGFPARNATALAFRPVGAKSMPTTPTTPRYGPVNTPPISPLRATQKGELKLYWSEVVAELERHTGQSFAAWKNVECWYIGNLREKEDLQRVEDVMDSTRYLAAMSLLELASAGKEPRSGVQKNDGGSGGAAKRVKRANFEEGEVRDELEEGQEEEEAGTVEEGQDAKASKKETGSKKSAKNDGKRKRGDA